MKFGAHLYLYKASLDNSLHMSSRNIIRGVSVDSIQRIGIDGGATNPSNNPLDEIEGLMIRSKTKRKQALQV